MHSFSVLYLTVTIFQYLDVHNFIRTKLFLKLQNQEIGVLDFVLFFFVFFFVVVVVEKSYFVHHKDRSKYYYITEPSTNKLVYGFSGT